MGHSESIHVRPRTLLTSSEERDVSFEGDGTPGLSNEDTHAAEQALTTSLGRDTDLSRYEFITEGHTYSFDKDRHTFQERRTPTSPPPPPAVDAPSAPARSPAVPAVASTPAPETPSQTTPNSPGYRYALRPLAGSLWVGFGGTPALGHSTTLVPQLSLGGEARFRPWTHRRGFIDVGASLNYTRLSDGAPEGEHFGPSNVNILSIGVQGRMGHTWLPTPNLSLSAFGALGINVGITQCTEDEPSPEEAALAMMFGAAPTGSGRGGCNFEQNVPIVERYPNHSGSGMYFATRLGVGGEIEGRLGGRVVGFARVEGGVSLNLVGGHDRGDEGAPARSVYTQSATSADPYGTVNLGLRFGATEAIPAPPVVETPAPVAPAPTIVSLTAGQITPHFHPTYLVLPLNQNSNASSISNIVSISPTSGQRFPEGTTAQLLIDGQQVGDPVRANQEGETQLSAPASSLSMNGSDSRTTRHVSVRITQPGVQTIDVGQTDFNIIRTQPLIASMRTDPRTTHRTVGEHTRNVLVNDSIIFDVQGNVADVAFARIKIGEFTSENLRITADQPQTASGNAEAFRHNGGLSIVINQPQAVLSQNQNSPQTRSLNWFQMNSEHGLATSALTHVNSRQNAPRLATFRPNEFIIEYLDVSGNIIGSGRLANPPLGSAPNPRNPLTFPIYFRAPMAGRSAGANHAGPGAPHHRSVSR